MTRSFRYTASAVCFAAALSLICTAPATAKDPSPGASTAKKAESSKRHKRHSAAAATPARPGWTGPDPTRGGASEYMRQMQREGRCFVDEGYGRYSACSNE